MKNHPGQLVFALLAFMCVATWAQEKIDLNTPPATDSHTVLLLHFDEGAGGHAKDTSGHNNHGRIAGAAWVEGKFGKALGFDGRDNFVDCGGERHQPKDFDFGETTDFTVELWFNTAAKGENMFLIDKKCNPSETEAGWMICMRKDGLIQAIMADGSRRVLLSGTKAVNNGVWHHVALVANRKGEARLYVDGIAEQTASMSEIIDVSNPRQPLRIGDRGHDGDFNGVIDEVRISTVARGFN